MDFSLSEEQNIFRDSVSRFVSEEYAFEPAASSGGGGARI